MWSSYGLNGATTRFLHDGDALVAEYDCAGNLLRRYVHGPGTDDPVAWYEGPAVTHENTRRLRSDERGSVVLVTDFGANTIHARNTYDEYGIPGSANVGRFQSREGSSR